MNQNKFMQNLRSLNNVEERSELAFKLFESNQVDVLALLLEIILNPDDYDTTLDYAIFIEITKKNQKERELIIERIINKIEESVISEEGTACAYTLGEIIRLQYTIARQIPNPRIPKVLLEQGMACITYATTEKLHSLMFALFQYANDSPLPEAELFLRQVLEMSKKESSEDLDILMLSDALDLLYFNNGESFLMEMKELFKSLKEDTRLASFIEMFIIEKEEELLEI
jgi:hypothetical protein